MMKTYSKNVLEINIVTMDKVGNYFIKFHNFFKKSHKKKMDKVGNFLFLVVFWINRRCRIVKVEPFH